MTQGFTIDLNDLMDYNLYKSLGIDVDIDDFSFLTEEEELLRWDDSDEKIAIYNINDKINNRVLTEEIFNSIKDYMLEIFENKKNISYINYYRILSEKNHHHIMKTQITEELIMNVMHPKNIGRLWDFEDF
jgi:hypothetical protein